jgi:hypothetical protein
MLKKRIFFWWSIPLCLLILFAWGYHWYTKPHQSAAGATTVLTIEADSLYRQYQADEHGADQKYLGKVIEVKGKISEIQRSGQSEIWILSGQPGGGGINCQLFPGDKGSSRQAKPGDRVTIKGRCTGFLMDVNLADCVPQ